VKIAILSKADAFGGGASRVAVDLAEGLSSRGHLVHHYASWRGGADQAFSRELYPKGFRRFFRYAHAFSMLMGFPDFLPLEWLSLHRLVKSYELVHFHDISSAISPLTVYQISRMKPVLWTVHDCSPFTGGCLYPLECKQFQVRCGSCPGIGEWPLRCYADFTGFMQSQKRKIAAQKSVTYITPSQWMADQAMSSGMFLKSPTVIANGIDINQFKPLEKNWLRDKYSLPRDRKIILLSAGSILDPRKGSKYALDVLKKIKDTNPFLLVVGNMNAEAHELFQEFDYFSTGYVGETDLIAEYYATADIFLFCSLADNLPLVVLETMACGVPTVGFATGGVPEMVLQDESGYLVEKGDVISLEQGIRKALHGDKSRQWGKNSRIRAEQEFSQEIFLANHLRLYDDILRKNEVDADV